MHRTLSVCAAFEWLPVSEVYGLARDLYEAGAWGACDVPLVVPDIPLTTLTVLRGATNAPSHTFSYYVPSSPEAAASAQRIQEFISEHFPGFWSKRAAEPPPRMEAA